MSKCACTVSLSLSRSLFLSLSLFLPLQTHKINPLFILNTHYLWPKTHMNLFLFTISPIHGPDSQQPIVTATEKRKSWMLMLLSRDCLFFLTGSVTMFQVPFYPQPSLCCRQSPSFLSGLSVFPRPLSLPLPPSFTSSKNSLLRASVRRLMQRCSAATQNMHRLT